MEEAKETLTLPIGDRIGRAEGARDDKAEPTR
jgi:hypothetical protein